MSFSESAIPQSWGVIFFWLLFRGQEHTNFRVHTLQVTGESIQLRIGICHFPSPHSPDNWGVKLSLWIRKWFFLNPHSLGDWGVNPVADRNMSLSEFALPIYLRSQSFHELGYVIFYVLPFQVLKIQFSLNLEKSISFGD